MLSSRLHLGTSRRGARARRLGKVLGSVLPAGSATPRVAVLTDATSSELADLVLQVLTAVRPASRVTTVEVREPTSAAVRGRLAGAGPLDLLVDATGGPRGGYELFLATFRHLGAGGTYLTTETSAAGQPSLADRVRGLAQEPTPARQAATQDRLEQRALQKAVGEVCTTSGYLTVRRRGRTLATLGEREMNEALAADPSRGRLVAELPGGAFRARCEASSSSPLLRDRTRARYKAPPMALREYVDAACGPTAVVTQRGLVTPDSFRHHQQKRLRNRSLQPAGPGFVRAPFDVDELPVLEGAYFHLDNEWRTGFGHALTEQVSRLWAWEQAKRLEPELRVLLFPNRGRGVTSWERVLWEAAGIDSADIVLADGPVRVERLLAATPMFSMPHYVHPRLVETWDRIGTSLRSASAAGGRGPRIFCSRRHGRRACTNREDVESLFAAHGFEIVHPEELPLPDQVTMYHEASVVAGFAGSGMFTVMFSDRPKHLILVRPHTYAATNEYMIAALRGHRLDQAVSMADGPPESLRSNQAPFTFDPGREGVWLGPILAAL